MKASKSQQSAPILVPATEGVKYAGSKLKLLPHIIPVVCGLRDVDTVLDGFSGSTRVSQALYQTGRFHVVSNDISVWSEVFARCYLQADRPAAYYQSLIDRLNALEGREGWFTETYDPPVPPEGGLTKPHRPMGYAYHQTRGLYFDLQEGAYAMVRPAHAYYIEGADAAALPTLWRMNFGTMQVFHLTGAQRSRILQAIITYYRLHLPGIPELKSLDVLREVFR